MKSDRNFILIPACRLNMNTLRTQNNLATSAYVAAAAWETTTVESCSFRRNCSIFGRHSQNGQGTTNNGKIQDTGSIILLLYNFQIPTPEKLHVIMWSIFGQRYFTQLAVWWPCLSRGAACYQGSHRRWKDCTFASVIFVNLGKINDGLWPISIVRQCLHVQCLYVASGKHVCDHSSVLSTLRWSLICHIS